MSTATATTYVEVGMAYARKVVSGEILACRWVKLACQRQLDDLDRWPSDRTGEYYYDEDAANRVCDILERFPHIKGVWAQHGKRLELEPWQCFIVCVVFGWMVTATGTRRFRVSYTEVPRKNAKSTLTSGVGNYLTACDGEHGALVVSAANTQKQAGLVFTDAQAMARREEGFRSRFGVEVLAHVIAQPSTASKFEALSAEYSNLDGLNLHAALIDELHAHPTRGLWDVLETATGSRAQPLIWAITTAGVNRASVCYDQRSHTIDILTGVVKDESYFGIIYTLDDGDDPYEESSWIKCNPNYGVSIYPEQLRSMAARAQTMPSMQAAFLMKHCNVWVNADHTWLPAGAWDRNAKAHLTIEDYAGEPCYIGVDLAMRSDIAAVIFLFPPNNARTTWACFGRYYLPEETVERGENPHYQGWERSGKLIATPGPITDFDYIVEDLLDVMTRFDVAEVVSDPYKNVPLTSALKKRGATMPIFDVRQSTAIMSPAMKEMEALVLQGLLLHDGDPILAWMVANVMCRYNERDEIYPKKESQEKKIDGVLALLMALDRALRKEPGTAFANGLWTV